MHAIRSKTNAAPRSHPTTGSPSPRRGHQQQQQQQEPLPHTTAMPPAPESDELVQEEDEMDVAAEEEDETQAPPRGKGKGKAKAKARKRGAADDGEEAAAGARPAKKRQSEGSAASSEARGGSVGSGRARDGEDDDEEEDDEEEEEEDDDMENDAQYFNPRSAKNQTGQSAETGIIVKIYCENFMCHRKLSVTFCPNVNFINGQNGSGKSAILAALQICLGARANVTHRGSKLSDLIRQGHNGAAVVRVTLLNKGVDAFKPQAYGDFITVRGVRCCHCVAMLRGVLNVHVHTDGLPTHTHGHTHTTQVERKIERNGSGSYALLKGNPHSDSPKFTTVSKSKEELVNMLDAFNIQVRTVLARVCSVCLCQQPSGLTFRRRRRTHPQPHTHTNRSTTPARCWTRRTPSASSRATPARSTASSRRSVRVSESPPQHGHNP